MAEAEPRRPGAEQRAHARSTYKGTIQIQCVGDPTWIEVYGNDVSRGGFSFFSGAEFRVGESVQMCLPDIDFGTFGATVRRVSRVDRDWLVGIQFDDLLPPFIEAALTGT